MCLPWSGNELRRPLLALYEGEHRRGHRIVTYVCHNCSNFGGRALEMRSKVALQARLTMDCVEAEQGCQVLTHSRIRVSLLDAVPAAECLLSLAHQLLSSFRQTGFPDRLGTLMRHVLHGMP